MRIMSYPHFIIFLLYLNIYTNYSYLLFILFTIIPIYYYSYLLFIPIFIQIKVSNSFLIAIATSIVFEFPPKSGVAIFFDFNTFPTAVLIFLA